MTHAEKGKQKADYEKKPSGGGEHSPIKCFKCGVEGHHAPEYTSAEWKCFKCGKPGHEAFECKSGVNVTCYNCGEQRHINTKCDKPEKE